MVPSTELLVKLHTCHLQGCQLNIVSLDRVSAIDRVCHGQEGATEKFFYMYMCHFSQLHVRLPLDGFTMGVLRALNVAPT